MARHVNYFGEILQGLALALPGCLMGAPAADYGTLVIRLLPFLYPIYYTLLFIYQQFDDDALMRKRSTKPIQSNPIQSNPINQTSTINLSSKAIKQATSASVPPLSCAINLSSKAINLSSKAIKQATSASVPPLSCAVLPMTMLLQNVLWTALSDPSWILDSATCPH